MVHRGRRSRHLLNVLKAGEQQSSRREASCTVSQLHTEIAYGISQRLVLRGWINSNPVSYRGVASALDVDF